MNKILVVQREGYWSVRREDLDQTISRHRSEKAAIDAGRDLGKREQVEFSVETPPNGSDAPEEI